VKTDAQLQRDVLDELDWEPSVDAAQIGVTAKDGVLALTGHVPVYAKKHTAEEVARRVHGVRGVANEIEVRPTDAHLRDDEDIAAAAVHALKWNAQVPDEKLQVTVEEGWIRIEGNVEHQFQKLAADRLVRHLHGARGVTNEILVAPQEATTEIAAGIAAAFRRSAVLDSGKLSVEVDGSNVTLTGDVRSHSERDEAERTAWAAPGVRRVENCVTVTSWGTGPAEEWGY
jgi:osmotically-inducible protein OsmY